jgi:hypothetical protein
MDRRTFLAGTGAVLVAAPLAAQAQQAGKVYRIGWLGVTQPPSPDAGWEAFIAGLRERGYVEGQNMVLERRYSEGREDRFPGFAAELVQMKDVWLRFRLTGQDDDLRGGRIRRSSDGAAGPMSTEAEDLHRIISASVRDMLDAYRIQASAGR